MVKIMVRGEYPAFVVLFEGKWNRKQIGAWYFSEVALC